MGTKAAGRRARSAKGGGDDNVWRTVIKVTGTISGDTRYEGGRERGPNSTQRQPEACGEKARLRLVHGMRTGQTRGIEHGRRWRARERRTDGERRTRGRPRRRKQTGRGEGKAARQEAKADGKIRRRTSDRKRRKTKRTRPGAWGRGKARGAPPTSSRGGGKSNDGHANDGRHGGGGL